jgi:hypothetical protein
VPSADARRALVLRAAGYAVALALGGVGLWLIVAGDSQRTIRLGAVASLWALLLGTFVMFGSRRAGAGEPFGDEPSAAPGQLSRIEDAAANRAYEVRLEQMLRREIQASVAAEMAFLRGELASLRTELLDKVGGQIALERIETTRIIGSDLEALQEEVRQLRERALLGEHSSVHSEATRLLEASTRGEDRSRRNRPTPAPGRGEVVDAQVVEDDDDDGYRGRRRRDDGPAPSPSPRDELPTRRGRHSPEGEELLARLLSRGD